MSDPHRLTLRLPADLVLQAQHLAVDLGYRSVNRVVEDALREHLARLGRTTPRRSPRRP
jgi:hypothetical protein